MKRLVVYLNAERIGELDQDDSGLLIFAYDPTWIARADAVPISRSLPLRTEAFRGKHARAFFAGLLPEQEQRERIASLLGISERNDFAMLERIGGECAGAIGLFPEAHLPSTSQNESLRELSDDELGQILQDLPQRPLLAGTEGIRLSLAGAQGKLPVVMRGNHIFLPLDNTPSTHILKPEPERFPGLAVNELFCMRLARAVGLNVPDVSMGHVGTKPYLVVARYDRRMDMAGRVVRMHQEDFCQALGFPPERKYQQEGGPLLRDCFQLLRDWSSAPVLDILGFVDGLFFNMLIGNADAHGKNHALLYCDQERKLSPFYDLVSTLVWPELSQSLSLRIGDCKTLREINPGHFRAMAQECKLGWPMIRDRMDSFCGRMLNALTLPLVDESKQGKPITDRIKTIIREQAARLMT